MEGDRESIWSEASTSSRQMECYWGTISRDHEVAILSECQEGAYLFRDCISEPELVTLSVRSGSMICRYRLKDDAAVEVLESSQQVIDDSGNKVNLKFPVPRPKGVSPVSSNSNTYDVPS